MDYLRELLKDHYGRHTKYQIKNFILRLNGKTDYGMYKQALREIKSRFDSLKTMYKEYKKIILDDNVLEYENSLKCNQINELLYEFNIFYNYAVQLKNKLGELTTERLEVLEADFWREQFKEKLCLELLGTGHISTSLLETIMYSESKIEILTFMANLDKKKALDFLTAYTVNLTLDSTIDSLKIDDIIEIDSKIEGRFLYE